RIRFSNTSFMPANLTSLPRLRAGAAAPLQRPPQPSMPILMASLPAAWALRASGSPEAAAMPTAEVFRNSRRDAVEDGERCDWGMGILLEDRASGWIWGVRDGS